MTDEIKNNNEENNLVQQLKEQVETLQKQLAESQEDQETKKFKSLLKDELEKFKKEEREINLETAHKIFEEAEENEKLALAERENKVLSLRDTKIERVKNDMIEQIKTIKFLINNRKYPQDFFSSSVQDKRTVEQREFYYRLMFQANNEEEFVNNFIEGHKRGHIVV